MKKGKTAKSKTPKTAKKTESKIRKRKEKEEEEVSGGDEGSAEGGEGVEQSKAANPPVPDLKEGKTNEMDGEIRLVWKLFCFC